MTRWKSVFALYFIVITICLTMSRGQDTVVFPTVTPTEPDPLTTPPDTQGDDEPPLVSKDGLLDWLVRDTQDDHHVEYEGYDGWYNNPTHPELGSVDSQLVRLLPPAYSDGVYAPSGYDRPNPLHLSRMLMNGTGGQMSNTGKTALLVFFGQQVVEELLDVQRPGCPPEYFNIKIPEDHEYKSTGHTEMPVLRSRYDVRTGQSPNNPRQQINEITPWIDGGLTYGISKGWSDGLRSFKDGLLISSKDGKYPALNDIKLPMANPPPPRDHILKPVERFYRLGNPRGNENPFLLTFGVFWFRWHNLLAKALKRRHPNWNDERLFNEARKWVIASHQHMVINEWLPEWLGKGLSPYKGYDSSIDPGIAHEFQTTAMRFGHTLVTSGGYRRSGVKGGCKVYETTRMTHFAGHKAVRTCNSFWNPREAVEEHDIDALILGLASQASEKEDNVIVEDLRGRVFGPLEFSRRDLMAINIQRARDHGLPDYKTARRVLKLKTFDSFSEMAKLCSNVYKLHPEIFDRILPEIYKNNTDIIDIWVGGILETEETRPGELFRTIIEDQMRRIRDGDRFWFENQDNGLFTGKQVERIKKINMYNLIWAITDIEHGDIQKNPFRLPADSNLGLNDICKTNLNMSRYPCLNVKSNKFETCYYLTPLAPPDLVSQCKLPETFDYFSGSEVSYALTFVGIGLFIIGCFVFLFQLTRKQRMILNNLRRKNTKNKKKTLGDNTNPAVEWIGKKEGTRQVILKFNENKIITIHRLNGEKVRFIDLTRVGTIELQVAVTAGYHSAYYILIRVAREYDLVLKFDSANERDNFIRSLEEYLGNIGVGRQRREVTIHGIINGAITKAERQKELEKFFRVVFAQAFNIEHNKHELLHLDSTQARNVINTEITLFEFAEALSLRPDAVFVEKMFCMADKEDKGYISFREFLDIIVVFAQGSPEDKMKLMFDMYDIDHSGKLSSEEFSVMIRSMIELANESLPSDQLNILLSTMFKNAGLTSKQDLTFDDFTKLMADYRSELGYAQLCLGGVRAPMQTEVKARQSAIIKAHVDLYRAYSYTNELEPEGEDTVYDSVPIETTIKSPTDDSWFIRFKRYCDNYKLHIFWLVLYTLLLFGIFVERMYYYSLEREHGGLRKIAGFGISVTRGAASVMMFTYSTILLTMCRNLITFLRETFLKNYIPFDYFVTFHKYIAFWGLIFTIIHTIGHAFNFYHIATQTADDLTCLFRDYYHATDELPKFHYWCYGTITGLTGILLVLVVAVIYIFALPFSRRNVFKAFWFTHNLYPVFYILMTLHGLGRVVQRPFFYYFFLGPLCVFVLDQLISISRKKIEISVVKTIIHPSDVLELNLKRPPNFQYRSGQWVRIACPLLNSDEYHPFTISSAPNEQNISLHIRAVGPWTTNIRQLLDPNNIQFHAYPKIYLDGPFGEGHQDWYEYEVSVLVGGGIGVTPFASILKDVVHKASSNTAITCKKIYFIWITRTQKHFEWMTDIIRYVESNDTQKLVECHIFITQFYQKFDLRTTMLYICERHFQKISNRSLFTGLQSITHFGRPDMKSFLSSLKRTYSQKISKVGVFSCGPPPMTLTVQEACDLLNKTEGINFIHHFENF